MTRRSAVAVSLMLHLGCSSASAPATRLAYCVEAAVKGQPRESTGTRASCDLQMPGQYLVVLHPEGALREQELVAAGLPPDLLPEMRVLKLGEQPGIYVISTDPGVSGTGTARAPLSTWTTYQMHFVQIDRPLVVAKTTQPVEVDIGGPSERRVIDGVH